VIEEEAEDTLEKREPTPLDVGTEQHERAGSRLDARWLPRCPYGARRVPAVRCSRERSNQQSPGAKVDEDAFNMSVRKFLKKLGVSAQREIELNVREQIQAGKLRGDERLAATATVVVSDLPREVVVTGTIALS
jgi:hypothetical protein